MQQGWDDFNTIFGTVVEELTSIASTVNTADIQLLAEAIKDARHICCYGVGREGLVMRALASSLHHLGFKTHFVGDITMPTIGDSDLFLVSAGPSYYSSVRMLTCVPCALPAVQFPTCMQVAIVHPPCPHYSGA